MSPLDPGQGFARLVTLANLEKFAPFLVGIREPSQQRQSNAEKNPASEAAEKLFSGVSIKSGNALRAAARTTAKPTVILSRTSILVAELPRASNRWNQANFDQESFNNFFHANTPGDLKLWHVRDDGTIAPYPEVRPGVTVRSRNFRIELSAAAGLEYPSSGKPIGVFVPIGPKQFRYMLIMPGSRYNKQVDDLLTRHAPSRRGRVRRVQIPIATAQHEWVECPLWSL